MKFSRAIRKGMKILGIDPGYQRMGWAIIETIKNQNVPLAFGCQETEKNMATETRLLQIFNYLMRVIKKYKPQQMAIEELFFAVNAKTAMGVSQARGVIMLAAAQCKIPVTAYAPLVVKQTICGSGTAEKSQVQKMIMRLFNLKQIPKPDDAADALAIALTHAYSYRVKGKLK